VGQTILFAIPNHEADEIYGVGESEATAKKRCVEFFPPSRATAL
jgi:hypothetical protein